MNAIECSLCSDKSNVSCFDHRMNIYRCQACDHTFTVRPADDLERYDEKYYLEKHPNWFANPNYTFFEWANRLIVQHYPAAKNLLDVGYGKGDFLKHIQNIHPELELVGIDSIKIEHPRIHFMQGDFFKDEIAERFDVVTSFMVIEHVDKPRLFVEKLAKYLSPAGLLIISTNNNSGMLYGIAGFLRHLGVRLVFDRVYSDHHLQHFTNRSLRLILERNGFEILQLKNHNYPLKAVDTPPANVAIKKLYLFTAWIIFCLSDILGNGFLQTTICRKKEVVG